MNRIVRENYPVADLPEDLREGFAPDARVTVTIIVKAETIGPERSFTNLMTLLSPPWLTSAEIASQLDDLREDRDL